MVARVVQSGVALRVLLLLMNSVANQGSAIHLSSDHRTDHLFSDTMSDPYDSLRRVIFSHVGYLLLCKHSNVLQARRRFMSAADYRALVVPQAVQPADNGARARAGGDAHAFEPLPMTREDTTTDSPFVLLVSLGEG